MHIAHTRARAHTHALYYSVQLSCFNYYWISISITTSGLVSWYQYWSTAQNYLVSCTNHDYWLLSQHYFAHVISLCPLWTILKAYISPVYATLLLHNYAMIQLKMSNLPHCLSTVHEVIHKTSDVTSLVFFFSVFGLSGINQITLILQQKVAFSKLLLCTDTIAYKSHAHTHTHTHTFSPTIDFGDYDFSLQLWGRNCGDVVCTSLHEFGLLTAGTHMCAYIKWIIIPTVGTSQQLG